MTFGATAGLALAAFVLPAAAEAVAPAAVAITAPVRPAAIAASVSLGSINSSYLGQSILDRGQGNPSIMTDTYGGSGFVAIQDGSSKWYEIQDSAGGNQCLNLDKVGASYLVDTEYCNFRSAELWWFYSGVGIPNTQIINQYGTTLLSHYACLWNTGSGRNPHVANCGHGDEQLWYFLY